MNYKHKYIAKCSNIQTCIDRMIMDLQKDLLHENFETNGMQAAANFQLDLLSLKAMNKRIYNKFNSVVADSNSSM